MAPSQGMDVVLCAHLEACLAWHGIVPYSNYCFLFFQSKYVDTCMSLKPLLMDKFDLKASCLGYNKFHKNTPGNYYYACIHTINCSAKSIVG